MCGIEKGRILLGFSIAFFGYVLSTDGVSLYIGISLTGIIVVLSLLILLKDKLSNKIERKIDEISQGIDVSWIALGLGLLGFALKSISLGIQQKSEPLIWLGIVIFILVGVCIGIANGRTWRNLLDISAKISIIFGIIFIVGGTIWAFFIWIGLDDVSILTRINKIAGEIVIIFTGIMLISLGLKKIRESHRWSYKNDFDFDEIYE